LQGETRPRRGGVSGATGFENDPESF
jgi:hypothetical protein